MVGVNNVFMVLGLLVFELILTLAAEMSYIRDNAVVLAGISFQLALAFSGGRVCMRQKQLFCSPFFLFFFMVVFFSVAGEIIFLVRDYLGVGWGGEPEKVSVFFRRFCLVSYAFLLLSSCIRRVNTSLFSIGEIGSSVFFKLLVLLLLGYAGLFISTNGFSQVSILSENPDAVRYENREVANVAIGSVFLLTSTLSMVVLVALREAGKISIFSCLFMFFVFYIPLLLSASRLLMLLPFVYFVLMRLQYLVRLRASSLWGVAALGIVVLLFAFVFGAYRTHGGGVDFRAVVEFLASDLFPEFSGTVRTQEFVNGEHFVTPLSTVLSGLFPGRFFQLFDLDKFDYFQLVGQLVGDMWNSQYSIRLSLMGELYYASWLRLWVFFVFLVLFMFYLHCKIYFSSARDRYVYIVSGLLVSLSVPYGAIFLVITIQFLVFSLVVFGFMRVGRWLMVVLSGSSGGRCESSSCA